MMALAGVLLLAGCGNGGSPTGVRAGGATKGHTAPSAPATTVSPVSDHAGPQPGDTAACSKWESNGNADKEQAREPHARAPYEPGVKGSQVAPEGYLSPAERTKLKG